MEPTIMAAAVAIMAMRMILVLILILVMVKLVSSLIKTCDNKKLNKYNTLAAVTKRLRVIYRDTYVIEKVKAHASSKGFDLDESIRQLAKDHLEIDDYFEQQIMDEDEAEKTTKKKK